jgi:D-glycero-D-manno-heptose 1,7-bisphosphate phosphatase
MRRAVFLDRDGVINRAVVRDGLPYPPADWAELEILPGVAAALNALKAQGFVLLVVTNQPDVARGTVSRATVDEIHCRLQDILPIDRVYACCHDSGDGCDCRKPRPGMLLQGARDFDIDLPASWLVGDRWRDCDAGRAAGVRAIFIDGGYRERRPDNPDHTVSSLADAARIILDETNR